MRIQINHIGKMEGHTDFVAEILRGDVRSAKMMTTEGARLIEGILVGRKYSEAPIITARICGICPVVHKISSIKSIENAFKIKPTNQTVKLRKLLLVAQMIHSHALHLFFLSLPDFFDITNDLKFVKEHEKETHCAIAVREWALKIIETVGGRAVHPIACEVGGFKVLPDQSELKNLADQYEKVLKNALCLINLVTKIKLPKLRRPTIHMALSNKDEYGYYSGDLKILNPDGSQKIIKAENFTKNIKEIEEPYRAAKSAKLDGRPFMVGALSRININHSQLHHLAKGILKDWKWKFPQYNPFFNIWAQAVEIVHFIEEAKKLLDDLVKNVKDEPSQGKKLSLISGANPLGRDTFGADAVEAPRGTLYHAYDIDKDGIIKNCQIITPTVSFLKNLEEDIAAYIPELSKLSAEKRTRRIRALIRAYDPCISCATH